jgi:hypothetical protein
MSKKTLTAAEAEALLRNTLAELPPISAEERERRKAGAERLKARLSSVPFYAEASKNAGPDYWDTFYAQRVKS